MTGNTGTAGLKISFRDDIHFSIGDLNFELYLGPNIRQMQSQPRDFILMKDKPLVEFYGKLLTQRNPRTIVEFGIQRGGSIAFFNQLLKPELHIAFELDNQRSEALDMFADEVAKEGRKVVCFYGVDQSDKTKVAQLVDDALATAGHPAVDLVVDDASHQYLPSKLSLECLLPRVSPGGYYVLEDWGWAHWSGYQTPEAPYSKQPALTNLVFEVMMLMASRSDIVKAVNANAVVAAMEKGNASLNPDNFTISTHIQMRGKTWTSI